jgi:hypothetical protein
MSPNGPVGTPDEAFELLRSANPVPDIDWLERAHRRRLDEILAAIIAGERRSSDVILLPSSRQRRRRRAIVAGVVAAALVAAAFTWAVTRHPSDPLSVSCYAAFDLDADRTQVDPDGRDYRDLCNEAWTHGRVVAGASQAPPLMVCVADQGSVAVLPAGTGRTCTRLGLAEAAPNDTSPDEQPDVATLGRLHHDLVEQFLSEGCVSASQAPRLIRDALVRHDLTDWEIESPESFPPERPCGSLAFDASTRTITVVPVPRPPQNG